MSGSSNPRRPEQRPAFMLKILAVFLCLLSPPMWGFTEIPETIQVGHYSVSLKVPDTWSVEVFEKQACIVYRGTEPSSPGVAAIEIRVYRIALSAAVAQVDGAVVAARLVRDDGLKIQQSIFKHWFLFPREPVVTPCPLGTAFVYGEYDSSFVDRDRQPHFARAALVLPADYRSRRVAYFVVAHQVGGGGGKQAQREYFDAAIQGIREPKG